MEILNDSTFETILLSFIGTIIATFILYLLKKGYDRFLNYREKRNKRIEAYIFKMVSQKNYSHQSDILLLLIIMVPFIFFNPVFVLSSYSDIVSETITAIYKYIIPILLVALFYGRYHYREKAKLHVLDFEYRLRLLRISVDQNVINRLESKWALIDSKDDMKKIFSEMHEIAKETLDKN